MIHEVDSKRSTRYISFHSTWRTFRQYIWSKEKFLNCLMKIRSKLATIWIKFTFLKILSFGICSQGRIWCRKDGKHQESYPVFGSCVWPNKTRRTQGRGGRLHEILFFFFFKFPVKKNWLSWFNLLSVKNQFCDNSDFLL